MVLIRLFAAVGSPLPLLDLMLRKRAHSLPRSLRDYRVRGNEVFITTFAKSGTNWSMQIAAQIAYRGTAEFEHIHQIVPWPDGFGMSVPIEEAAQILRAPTGKVVVKTHLAANVLSLDERCTYITVLRDPKEVIVSAYHFLLGIMGLLKEITFDQWFERLGVGALLDGWVEHSASFWALRERENMLVLNFRDMKRDLKGTVRTFAAAMGVELEPEEEAEVLRRSSFSYMKARESCFAPPQMPFMGGKTALMMRSGKSGASGELMSPAQQATVDRICQEKLRAIGSDLPYSELFD